MEKEREIFSKIVGHMPDKISQLYGGLNSTNYLIDNRFVLRIKGKPIDNFYSASQEKIVEEVIALYNLGVKVIHLDALDGTKLTKYISNTHFLTPKYLKSEIKLVAQTLAKLHSISPREIQPFNSMGRLNSYKAISQLDGEFTFEKDLINSINDINSKANFVLCHNDLVKGNLLFKQNRLYLIDYEYAGLNNPLFDLASFITENDISDLDIISYFLAEYSKIKSINLDAFNQYCQFLDLLWYYWANAMFVTTKEPVYEEIAKIKKLRLNNHQLSK